MLFSTKVGMADIDPSEPKLPRGKDVAGLPLRRAHGPLFDHDVSARDVGQGNLGDCFFLASIAAVAQRRPDLVRRAIHDNGDDTYTVHFKDRHADGSVHDVPVTVDDLLPMKGTHPAFAEGRAGDRRGPEIWPAILEKAYAVYRGGYQVLDRGGSAAHALEALTGAPCDHFDVHDLHEDEVWQRLADATRAGRPMVSGTTTAKGLRRATEEKDDGGFFEEHDYTLLGVEERAEGRFVKLRNPWGDRSPHLPGVERRAEDDGVFEIPFALYEKAFSDVTISGA
jgi:Calpain family cysteine protease